MWMWLKTIISKTDHADTPQWSSIEWFQAGYGSGIFFLGRIRIRNISSRIRNNGYRVSFLFSVRMFQWLPSSRGVLPQLIGLVATQVHLNQRVLVLKADHRVENIKSMRNVWTSVADPFHFDTNPDPRIRFLETRIRIRPKIGKILTFSYLFFVWFHK